MIYQKKPDMCEEIRKLLGDLCTSESIHPTTGVICFRISASWKRNIEYHGKDYLPGIVSRLSNESAYAMWDAMVKAEGSNAGLNGIQFGQVPGPVMDSFQILCQILNKPFNAKPRFNGAMMYGYVKNRNKLKYAYQKKSKVKYKGTVWCPKTKNSTWVMRQNGSVVCTGNTWTRHNIPNQISAIALFPQMYSILPKLQDFAQFDAPEYDPKYIPEWMKQEGMFPIGRTEEGMLKMFRPDFPMTDLNMLPVLFDEGVFAPEFSFDEIKDDIVNMTSPLVKWAASAMTEKGYDFFYRTELTDKRKAPYLMRLFLSKPKTMEALDGFLRAIGKEDGLEAEIDDEGKLKINPRLAVHLEQFLPIIRTMDFLFYSGFEFGDRLNLGIEEAVEEFTNAEDEYEGIEQAFQVLSFWTGIKIYPEDIEEEREQYGRDVYYDAMEARTEDRRGTPEFERRSLDRMRATDRRIRRLGL
jgi:hypothetical protein